MVTDGRGEDKKTPHLKYMFHNDETCHTYTLPKEYQNIYIYINQVSDLLGSANTSIFHQKLAIFVVSANKKYILIHKT